MLLVVVVAVPILIVGFFEARKAYWDHRVNQMCEKDGGVTVYERIVLSEEEYKRLGGTKSGLAFPLEQVAEKSGFPYFRRVVDVRIRDASPEVVRFETLLIRRSDRKVLGRVVQYGRSGGDFPTGISSQTYFMCPRLKTPFWPAIFSVKIERTGR